MSSCIDKATCGKTERICLTADKKPSGPDISPPRRAVWPDLIGMIYGGALITWSLEQGAWSFGTYAYST